MFRGGHVNVLVKFCMEVNVSGGVGGGMLGFW